MPDAINDGNVYSKRRRRASFIVRLLLFALVIVCVFDPADRILGAKVWLFLALWVATVVVGLLASDEICLPADLVLLVSLFVAIPLLSIFWYYLVNGTQPYAGFSLFKSYLFLSLAIVLVINRVDLVPFLSGALTVLALLTIAIFVALQWHPYLFLYRFAESFGVLVLGTRTYDEGLTFHQVFFVTSPMLAISIAYYFDRAMSEPDVGSKLVHLVLTAISIIGMFLVGLRNTMAVALLLPFFLWPLYTRRVALNGLISLGVLVVLSLPFIKRLAGFLNPTEVSNNIKLTFLGDYAVIFSNPVTLLFGQGLGAYYRWSSAGQLEFEKTGANFYFITELTFAELIRSFGLVGALIMMMLLLFPVARAFLANTDGRQRALALAFLAYLGMSATNPLLFSSLGMLFFSVLLANTFKKPDDRKYGLTWS